MVVNTIKLQIKKQGLFYKYLKIFEYEIQSSNFQTDKVMGAAEKAVGFMG